MRSQYNTSIANTRIANTFIANTRIITLPNGS
jgi:hypothetical protein